MAPRAAAVAAVLGEEAARVLLGVAEGYGAAEVRRAFRRRALACHPDKVPEAGPEECRQFQLVSQARDLLLTALGKPRTCEASGAAADAAAGCGEAAASRRRPAAGFWGQPRGASAFGAACGAASGMAPTGRLQAEWKCSQCRVQRHLGAGPGRPCVVLPSVALCFCGHALGTHSQGVFSCSSGGCRCNRFHFLPPSACTCGHGSGEHSAVSHHGCEADGCLCQTFHSLARCACGHEWACHTTEFCVPEQGGNSLPCGTPVRSDSASSACSSSSASSGKADADTTGPRGSLTPGRPRSQVPTPRRGGLLVRTRTPDLTALAAVRRGLFVGSQTPEETLRARATAPSLAANVQRPRSAQRGAGTRPRPQSAQTGVGMRRRVPETPAAALSSPPEDAPASLRREGMQAPQGQTATPASQPDDSLAGFRRRSMPTPVGQPAALASESTRKGLIAAARPDSARIAPTTSAGSRPWPGTRGQGNISARQGEVVSGGQDTATPAQTVGPFCGSFATSISISARTTAPTTSSRPDGGRMAGAVAGTTRPYSARSSVPPSVAVRATPLGWTTSQHERAESPRAPSHWSAAGATSLGGAWQEVATPHVGAEPLGGLEGPSAEASNTIGPGQGGATPSAVCADSAEGLLRRSTAETARCGTRQISTPERREEPGGVPLSPSLLLEGVSAVQRAARVAPQLPPRAGAPAASPIKRGSDERTLPSRPKTPLRSSTPSKSRGLEERALASRPSMPKTPLRPTPSRVVRPFSGRGRRLEWQ